jgi:hypothetical protein
MINQSEIKLNCCIYCDAYYQYHHQCKNIPNPFIVPISNMNESNEMPIQYTDSSLQLLKGSTERSVGTEYQFAVAYEGKLQRMQTIIDELKEKQISLEREVVTLRNIVQSKQKKGLLDHLNTTITHCVTFFEWIQQLKINESHLNCVFENNLLYGMKRCIEENIQLQPKIPIRIYKENPNAVFIFEQEGEYNDPKNPGKKWQLCKRDYFENITYHLSLKFMDEYLKWEKTNERKIEDKKNTENLIFKLYWNCNKTKQKQNDKEFANWLIAKIQE